MSWMDSWSRPSKHQATPAPYYLLPGGEATPYCQSCGRVISSRRTGVHNGGASKNGASQVKYCSNKCRGHKPGKLDREIEATFVRLLRGEEVEGAAGPAPVGKRGSGKKIKGDSRILVSCEDVERLMFGQEEENDDGGGGSVSGVEESGSHSDEASMDPVNRTDTLPQHIIDTPSKDTGTLENPTQAPEEIDYDVLARLSIRSGTRIRPPQDVSEVNGSVGGEKGRAERIDETGMMMERRQKGLRRARQREMVRCAARRGVVFGLVLEEGKQRRKCEAVMLGKVVEPSYAKGDWSVRWRE